MKYYPIFLRVEGRACIVVGGGSVAERKVASLRQAGAQVTVVSPRLTASLAARAESGEIGHRARCYQTGDLKGAFLAYAATNDEDVHAAVAREAEELGVPLNVVDRPRWCSFIVPAVMARGDLMVAVSTSGGSPALARRVRQDIERALGPEYERALAVLACLRRHLEGRGLSADERRRILTGLVQSELLECLSEPDSDAVDRLLARYAGEGVSLARIGASLDV
jgi:precorrin-2 dehydrogenase/sirohydrochlorin ferrochelatase